MWLLRQGWSLLWAGVEKNWVFCFKFDFIIAIGYEIIGPYPFDITVTNVMKILKIGIGVAAVLFIFGCVPNATIYYRPTVDVESVHEKGHCVPMERYVNFEIETKSQALKVRGSGNNYTSSHGEVSEGQFVIYGEWNEIEFKDDEFYIISTSGKEKVGPIFTYGIPHHLDGYSSFNAGAVFPRQEGYDFDVVFPSLIIDGEEVSLPVLHVKRTTWVGVSPFNC